MTSLLQVVEETGIPGKNQHLTPSHWQLSHMPWPGFESIVYAGENRSMWGKPPPNPKSLATFAHALARI